jgi:hypothetical protein
MFSRWGAPRSARSPQSQARASAPCVPARRTFARHSASAPTRARLRAGPPSLGCHLRRAARGRSGARGGVTAACRLLLRHHDTGTRRQHRQRAQSFVRARQMGSPRGLPAGAPTDQDVPEEGIWLFGARVRDARPAERRAGDRGWWRRLCSIRSHVTCPDARGRRFAATVLRCLSTAAHDALPAGEVALTG